MQLRIIFHKTLKKKQSRVKDFRKIQSQRLSSFSAIKITVTEVQGGRSKFVLLFLSAHINFQC